MKVRKRKLEMKENKKLKAKKKLEVKKKLKVKNWVGSERKKVGSKKRS